VIRRDDIINIAYRIQPSEGMMIGLFQDRKWTAADIPDQQDRIAVITGANSGIGYEAALALAKSGATVIIASRSGERGQGAVQRIRDRHQPSRVEFMQLDLASLESIALFAEEFAVRHDRLDLLINNAGVMMTPFQKTEDGFELQFGTNHLGHFALTGHLLELVARTPGSRIVTVSSMAHKLGRIDFEDLNGESNYNRTKAYEQSKLANLLFTYELQRRLESNGSETLSVAAHPGWTATNLQSNTIIFRMMNPLVGMTPEQGALPSLYAAVAPGVKSGEYFGPRGLFEIRGYPTRVKSSRDSRNLEDAARLWEISEKMTGVKYP